MSDQTTALNAGRTARAVGIESPVAQERVEGMPFPVRAESATPEERDAILASLYEERSSLLREQRLASLSDHDAEYLIELEQLVRQWEAVEAREEAAQDEDLWRKIDEIAGSLIGVQAAIEQQRR